MSLVIELPADQFDAFAARARELGVSPKQYAEALVREAIDGPSDDFKQLAADIVEKNLELYKRLA